MGDRFKFHQLIDYATSTAVGQLMLETAVHATSWARFLKRLPALPCLLIHSRPPGLAPGPGWSAHLALIAHRPAADERPGCGIEAGCG